MGITDPDYEAAVNAVNDLATENMQLFRVIARADALLAQDPLGHMSPQVQQARAVLATVLPQERTQ